MTYTISADTKKFIENFVQKYTIEETLKEELITCKSVKELAEKIESNSELQTMHNELKTKYINNAFETFSDIVTGYIAKKYIQHIHLYITT